MENYNTLTEEQLLTLSEIIREQLSESEKNSGNFSEVALLLLENVPSLESEKLKQEIVKNLWTISLKK